VSSVRRWNTDSTTRHAGASQGRPTHRSRRGCVTRWRVPAQRGVRLPVRRGASEPRTSPTTIRSGRIARATYNFPHLLAPCLVLRMVFGFASQDSTCFGAPLLLAGGPSNHRREDIGPHPSAVSAILAGGRLSPCMIALVARLSWFLAEIPASSAARSKANPIEWQAPREHGVGSRGS